MFKKTRKGQLKKLEFKANKILFGDIGLKAVESGVISSRQIEAARQAVSRKLKRKAKIWIKIFPNLPVTSKPAGIRMGEGKGQITHWVARVKSGTVLLEICGNNVVMLKEALKTGKSKFPLKTKIFY